MSCIYQPTDLARTPWRLYQRSIRSYPEHPPPNPALGFGPRSTQGHRLVAYPSPGSNLILRLSDHLDLLGISPDFGAILLYYAKLIHF